MADAPETADDTARPAGGDDLPAFRYTAALGFDTISSEHAPCNNPILIAKLRAGFRLYALDMDPMAGPSVVLRYFHNPEHLAAYELRCGQASLTPRLAESGIGAWSLLRDQMLKSAG